MKNISILIIQAEGDSVETESWYAKDISRHYGTNQVQIFQYNGNRSIINGIQESVTDFLIRMKENSKFMHKVALVRLSHTRWLCTDRAKLKEYFL